MAIDRQVARLLSRNALQPTDACSPNTVNGVGAALTSELLPNFPCMLPMGVAPFSSGGVLIRYVLPVLLMTSYLHTTAKNGRCELKGVYTK